MANSLRELLILKDNKAHATAHGAALHHKLQFVFVDKDNMHGDAELAKQIVVRPELCPFFSFMSQTEVPLAGTVSGRFISRRIDRMLINHDTKTIDVLDYKTDINRDALREKYINQIGEYIALLKQIYPGYTIHGFLLWTHNWDLEKIY